MKSLFSQPLSSWNPFTLYSDYSKMTKRMRDKGIEGNMKGEGVLQGGLVIVTPDKG